MSRRVDGELPITKAQEASVLVMRGMPARTDIVTPTPHGLDANNGLALGLLRLLLAAIGVMWATAALAADAKTADAKTEKPGFAETVPPSLELGVGGRDASDVSEPEAGAEPGQVKPPQTGAAPSANTADPDIDIAEVGRLMNAQSGGGDAQTPGTPLASSRTQDVGPLAHALQGLVALCVVLMLIVLVAYVLRKFGRRTPLLTALAGSSLATVLGKVHLARGVSLHFIQTGG
ncbi:MAG: hypothetical protein HZB26_22125, partial [Candidatus Hydrogenedentes bacterium]|nr:hypothetical protein [Candidatus Hydrogenedentota bacterium]